MRWLMLAVLFVTRTCLAFTFQGLAAVAPLAGPALGLDHAEMGALISLYWLPGVFLALPAGLLAQRFGAKRLALLSLALLAGGTLLLGHSPSYASAAAARLAMGSGNALLSVIVSAMVADWFRSRELATALAITFGSWQFGLALTLASLPLIAERASWQSAIDASALLCLGTAALMALAYRAPPHSGPVAAPPLLGLPRLWQGRTLLPAFAALLWTTYNAGQLVFLTYAPPLLAARGTTLAAAAAAVSLAVWLAMASMPLGGIIADRSGRLGAVVALGCTGAALGGVALGLGADAIAACAAIGFFIGLPAGSLFSLPVRAAAPEEAPWALGWFMTVYYLLLTLAQWLGGAVRQASGSDRTTVFFAAFLLFLTALAILPYLTIARAGAHPLRKVTTSTSR